MRAPRRRLPRPCIARRDAGRHAEGAAPQRRAMWHLDHRIVADDADLAHRDSRVAAATNRIACSEGLPVRIIGAWVTRRMAPDDGVAVADGAALPRGEERHVGRHVEFRAGQDGMAGGLDVLHAAIRMPADVHRIHRRSSAARRHARVSMPASRSA